MKTILVTGSAGFIGFHTAKRLLEAGYFVVGIDDFNDYYDVQLKKGRNALLEAYPNYKLYRGTIADLDFVKKVFSENTIDKVCHLAAQAGVRHSLKDPYAYSAANLSGFLNVLNEAKNFGVKDFIFASSSSVYGEQDKAPFKETFLTDSPISLYAATKKSAELMAYAYHHLFGMRCVGLRFFTVYGPWGRPDMAIFDFTRAILIDEPIRLFNDGKMKRAFTHVSDIADGVVKSLESGHEWAIINLGNDESVELLHLIETLENALGKTAVKELLPIQPGDVPETHADITEAKKLLGWQPRISVDEGIPNFVSWYLEQYAPDASVRTEVAEMPTVGPAPKVSLIMSVYNAAAYLEEAMDSILSQTFTDFEFIIFDDSSNDNTPAILKAYADKDARIRIVTNEVNMGLTKNLNRGIRLARGTYIARFDGDDVSLPTRFEKQVAFLDAHPHVGVISMWADVIDGSGRVTRTIKYPTTDAELRRAMIHYNPFFHPGLMMRKDAAVEAGLYNPVWKQAQDYELYFRIAKKHELANIPEVLLKFRETSGSITAKKNRRQVAFALEAKKKAIREGQYPKWNYIYLWRSYVSWVIPVGIKRFFKRLFLNKKKW